MYIILGTIAIVFGIPFLWFLGNVFYYLTYFSIHPLEKKTLKETVKNMPINELEIKETVLPKNKDFAEKTKEQEKGKLAPKNKPPTKRNSEE